MIRMTLHLAVGVLLSGCTVNNFHTDNQKINSHLTSNGIAPKALIDDIDDITDIGDEMPEVGVVVDTPKPKLKPRCDVYKPLPVPKPVRIDLKELENAKTEEAINEITLRNVKVLHKQLTDYASNQRKHYLEYTKRCVLK